MVVQLIRKVKNFSLLSLIFLTLLSPLARALSCNGLILKTKPSNVDNEVTLFKVVSLTTLANVTLINLPNEEPRSFSIVSYFDLSFEFINGEEKTSMIALTSEGELYHILKNNYEWGAYATRLSGLNKVIDFKVTNTGKVLVEIEGEEKAYVFSSKKFYEDEDQNSNPLINYFKDLVREPSSNQALIPLDINFNDGNWMRDPLVIKHSRGNLADFDTSNLIED